MFNKTRICDHLISIGATLTGFAVGNVLPVSDPKTDSVAFLVGGTLILLGWAGVSRLDNAPGVEVEPVPAPRVIPNLNAVLGNGFEPIREYESAVKTVAVKELDPRIKQWAWAVTYENTSMVQTKWCGRKKPFSKPGYVAFIFEMLRDGYITLIDPKDPKSSYRPNGRKGREYIRDLAVGREFRPFPTLDKSDTDIQFLRAQVRRADFVGQGSG